MRLTQTAFAEYWSEGNYVPNQNSPYYATDNGELAKNFLSESAISVGGYIEQDNTINRKAWRCRLTPG